MYLRNIFFVVLTIYVPSFIGGLQVLSGTHSAKPSWIHGGGHHQEDISNDKDNHQQHLQPQYPTQQTQTQYTSQYPSEYTPYYPPQYTPPYPTQSKPQAPHQFKPPQTVQNKPHQVLNTQVQIPHQAQNQILYPSSINPKPTLSSLVVDQFNHRFPDGSYEFRYELPDETVRYERGYFIRFHHQKSLVVRGYYSYRLPPGNRYLTVFYTADHYGFRQDSSAITQHRPQLPRSLGERRILPDEEDINVISSINENKLE